MNVPAGCKHLRVLERGGAPLPAGMTKFYLRSDTEAIIRIF